MKQSEIVYWAMYGIGMAIQQERDPVKKEELREKLRQMVKVLATASE